jgi:hypothetical protein
MWHKMRERFGRRPKLDEIPALFLHIQKTAGTSIVYLAKKYYGGGVINHGKWVDHPPERFKEVSFISGHMGYDYARHFMKDRFTFTFLRDPAERILSMYYFCRSRDPQEFAIYKKAQELDLTAFLEAGFSDPLIKNYIWNHQVWQLAYGYTYEAQCPIGSFSESELLELAKSHLAEFSYVGFTETFDQDALVILANLNFPEIQRLPQRNRTPGRPTSAEVSPEVRQLLDELTVLDRQLYDYARTLKRAD